MMKKILVLILLLGVLVMIGCEDISKVECEVDDDCTFLWTAYTEDEACSSCSYADKGFVCMNKEVANKEIERIVENVFGGPGGMPLCEPCRPDYSDFESHSCECVENKCEKVGK